METIQEKSQKKVINKKVKSIIHEGYDSKLSVGSIAIPIFPTTAYRFLSAEIAEDAFNQALAGESLSNLIYSRVNNSNAEILENKLIFIEHKGVEAAVFGSGMAAIITTVFATCTQDKVIAYTSPLYGGTYDFLNGYLRGKLGYSLLELSDSTEESCQQIIELGDSLGLLYIETPANPTLQMFDIEKLCAAAKKANPESYSVLDNTFMGIFQQGFTISDQLDLIVYSGTKFISGHSDVLNGCVICNENNKEIMKEIKSLRIILGNILHPFQCNQVSTHLITYPLRMEKQSEQAGYIVNQLNTLSHKKLLKIVHPDVFKRGTIEEAIYKKQCSSGSSLVCLLLDTDKAGTFRFLNRLNQSGIIQLAVSLGSVESLVTHPASTTHSEIDAEKLKKFGISDNLVRLSIGLEDPDDLVRVILEALQAI